MLGIPVTTPARKIMNPKPGYSAPVSAPLYDEPPYLYRGGNSLICVFRANMQAIDSLVPEPLKPAPGGLVYGWQNDFHAVGLGSYHEAIISIPVEFKGKPGLYMAYLYLDSDSPIAAGREIFGFPKKFARFSLSDHEDVLTRVTERGGVELLKFSVQFSRPGKLEDLAALANPIYNLKIIPSVQKGAPPDVRQLTAMTLQNIVVNRIVEGNATVDFGKSPADPLYLLQPLEVLKGIYCEVDFDLPYGEVVHEYQAKKLPSEVYAAAS
jgi:acetoacetate decarboxylase